MRSMESYSRAAVERAMKVQEVLLRAMAGKSPGLKRPGFTDRHLRRIRERNQEFGYDGLFDRRRGKDSPKRVPVATVEAPLGAAWGEVFRSERPPFSGEAEARAPDRFEPQLGQSSTAGNGLSGARARKRGVHRQRRPRRLLPGKLWHIDGSRDQWFQDERWYG